MTAGRLTLLGLLVLLVVSSPHAQNTERGDTPPPSTHPESVSLPGPTPTPHAAAQHRADSSTTPTPHAAAQHRADSSTTPTPHAAAQHRADSSTTPTPHAAAQHRADSSTTPTPHAAAQHRADSSKICIKTDNVFNCSGLALDAFPAQIPTDCSVLDMGRNRVGTFPREVVLDALITLSVHDNQISSVAGVIFHHQFPQLVELDVSGNSLSSPPENLPETLRKLDVERNELTGVDVVGLDNLEEVYLQHNLVSGSVSVCGTLRAGAECRGKMPLTTLALSHNNIDQLPDNGMTGLESLKVLSLKNNKIKRLKKDTFRGAPSLTLLDLSDNEISVIDAETFEAVPSLQYLYLSKNRLRVVPGRLPLLEWLDVSYNKIRAVNETLKATLYPIEMVHLGHNPWHCDCHLVWVKEWWDRRDYILQYSDTISHDDYVPSCTSPPALAGERWSMLADDVFTCSQDQQGTESAPGGAVSKKTIAEWDQDLDPFLVPGENPKYIQAYGLHVQVRGVQATSVTLEWHAPPQHTNLVIQYFIQTSEVETTLFSQVQAAQGHFVLRNLEADSDYTICVMPKTETLSLSAPLDDCIRVRTQRDVATQPRGFLEGMLSFHMDHTLESKFKLIFGCFFVSVVIVASGLLLAEGVLRLCPQAADKEHTD